MVAGRGRPLGAVSAGSGSRYAAGTKGGIINRSSISGEAMSAFGHTAQAAADRRSDRRFHIIMVYIFSGVLIVPIAVASIVIVTEPARRTAFVCQETGFSEGQCRSLYGERRDADTAALAAIAIGA